MSTFSYKISLGEFLKIVVNYVNICLTQYQAQRICSLNGGNHHSFIQYVSKNSPSWKCTSSKMEWFLLLFSRNCDAHYNRFVGEVGESFCSEECGEQLEKLILSIQCKMIPALGWERGCLRWNNTANGGCAFVRTSELTARYQRALPAPSQCASPNSFEFHQWLKQQFLKMKESEFHLVLLPQNPLSNSFFVATWKYMK